MKKLILLLLSFLTISANAEMDKEKLEAILSPLRQKALNHQGRILTYKITKSSNKDHIDLKFYQTPKNIKNLLTINAFVNGELIFDHAISTSTKNKNTRLDWINFTHKEWMQCPSFEKIIDPIFKALFTSYTAFGLPAPVETANPSIYGGIEDASFIYGISINSKPTCYWDSLISKISSSESTTDTTTLTVNKGAGKFVFDNKTGLMNSHSITTEGITRTTTLINTAPSNGEWITNTQPQKDFKVSTLTPDSPQLKAIIPNLLNQLVDKLATNPDLIEELQNNPEPLKQKLRQHYLSALQPGGLLEAEGKNFIPLKVLLVRAIEKTNANLTPDQKTIVLKEFADDDQFRKKMADTFIKLLINDQDFIQKWDTQLLTRELKSNPDAGENRFLILSTIRNALLEAHIENQTHQAITEYLNKNK